MIKFSIPDSNIVRDLNFLTLQALKEHKDWFYDDFIAETAYGCPLFTPWNGNRSTNDNLGRICLNEIDNVYDSYGGYGIEYRLTFTNFLLRPEHLYDTVGNALARLLNEKGGYVTLSIPLMEQHIRNNYPNLKICWSVTTEYPEGIKSINEVLSKNMIVILPIEYNNDEKVIDELVNLENVEILVNEDCIDNCPKRKEHFTRANQIHLLEKYVEENDEECFFNPPGAFWGLPSTRVVHRDAMQMYVSKGIDHFKIAGRQNDKFVYISYLEYLVLPDCKDIFTNFLKENGLDYPKMFMEEEK